MERGVTGPETLVSTPPSLGKTCGADRASHDVRDVYFILDDVRSLLSTGHRQTEPVLSGLPRVVPRPYHGKTGSGNNPFYNPQ